MTRNGSLLLITPEELLAEHVRELVQQYVVVRWMRTPDEALRASCSAAGWCGLVFDLDSTSGNPFEVVKRVRGDHLSLPALGLTTRADAETVNAAHAARVEIIIRPFSPANLIGFANRLVIGEQVLDERVRAWLSEQASVRRLKPRDIHLIAHALAGEPREQILRRLGITQNTLKTHIRSLLHKFQARSMNDLVKITLREARLARQRPVTSGRSPEA
jgi:DNA-binding NarL/FixJ family response regulator